MYVQDECVREGDKQYYNTTRGLSSTKLAWGRGVYRSTV